MKTLSSLTLVILLCFSGGFGSIQAQSPEDKIELMADALRARSRGDYVEAKAKLEELILLAPEDPNIQRLLVSVNEELARQEARGSETALSVDSAASTWTAPVVSDPGIPSTPIATPAAAPIPVSSPASVPVGTSGIEDLIVRGKAQFVAGEYDAARETFSQVEARDPHNSEAKYFQTRIAQILYDGAQIDREKTKTQMLQEVAPILYG